MALHINDLKRDDRIFVSNLGVKVKTFDQLLNFFTLAWHELQEERYEKRVESYKEYGMTAKFYPNDGTLGILNSLEQKLHFFLRFLKQYPSYDVLGSDFGMSGNTAHENIQNLFPVFNRALTLAGVTPQRKFQTAEEMEQYFNDLNVNDLFIDVAERPVVRPKDNEAQKQKYSGKKKKHTVQNTVISDAARFILFLGYTVSGSMHDFRLLKKEFEPGGKWFEKFKVWVDLGYKGFSKIYEVLELMIPHKKPRKSKKNPSPSLTPEQKIENRGVSSSRIVVEHAIGGMKHMKILAERLRSRMENFDDQVAFVCASLWNFKLKF